jgi:hypothetical protein
MKGLRGAAEIPLYRSAARETFESEFGDFCNLTISSA